MEIQRDIAPPVAPPPVAPEKEEPRRTRVGGMSFSEALAKVEAHRDKVQIGLGLSLVARLFQEIDFKRLIAEPPSIIANLPFIGIALLSYMIVLWFLAARTRDRWGFGMALGVGVLQATYALVLLVTALMSKQADTMLMAKSGSVIITH